MFNAKAAWLVLAVIAFNLTPATGTLATPDLARATTATLRRNTDHHPSQDRVLSPPDQTAPTRGLALGDPAWTTLFDRVSDPPPALLAA